jgi:hypothetical protein
MFNGERGCFSAAFRPDSAQLDGQTAPRVQVRGEGALSCRRCPQEVAGALDRAPLVAAQWPGLWQGQGHGSPMSGSMPKARSMSLAAFADGPAFSALMTISQSSAASGRRIL